jgi:hypothetical protein
MGDYVNTGKVTPWKDFYREITAIVIGDEVTYIGNRAFKGLNKVTTATIGSAVATTGYECFYGCTSLVNVEVKTEVLTSIGALCFYNCAFDSFEIPATVTNLANRAFKLCKNLTSIESHAFAYCYSLENIIIPTKVSTISSYAFFYCDNLQNVIFRDPTTWYYTYNSDYIYGTEIDVTDEYQNAFYLRNNYDWYWYKE